MAAPRMGIGLGRRRNRVIPNMKRRVARNTIFDTGSSFVRGHGDSLLSFFPAIPLSVFHRGGPT
eukprot:1339641-Amorphochlora_amoeboformis.AAC.1